MNSNVITFGRVWKYKGIIMDEPMRDTLQFCNNIKWDSEYLKRKAMKADRLCKFIKMFQRASVSIQEELRHTERPSPGTGFFR